MTSGLKTIAARAMIFVFLTGGAVAEEFSCAAPVTKAFQSRIVGGKPASPPDWPFIVALFSNEIGPFCGGSIISDRWILTAAHCVSGTFDVSTLNIRRPRPDGTPAGERAKVIKTLVHPDYVDAPLGSDVALLKLDHPLAIQTSQFAITATKTTEKSFGFAGVCAATGGWGATRQGGNVSKILRDVDVPIISDEDCRAMQGSRYNAATHICAGYKQGSKDSCQGDSGGPIIVRAGPTGFLLVGVVSFGNGCAQPDAPGFYSRVSTYRDWVFKTIDEN